MVITMLKINEILTLSNGEKYLTLNETEYLNDKYFLVMGVDSERNIISGKVAIIREWLIENETFIQIIEEPELIMELTKRLKEQI